MTTWYIESFPLPFCILRQLVLLHSYNYQINMPDHLEVKVADSFCYGLRQHCSNA